MLPVRTNSKATILVVDDSPEMLKYFQMLLELDSYQVKTASDGFEALELVQNGCFPELVLLDLQMPGMDGMRTLWNLLQLQPGLKVIMCSGVDDPMQMERATWLGARAYLKKPVARVDLSAEVERCLAWDGEAEGAGMGLVKLPPPPRYEEN